MTEQPEWTRPYPPQPPQAPQPPPYAGGPSYAGGPPPRPPQSPRRPAARARAVAGTPLTWALIGLNVLVFLYQQGRDQVTLDYGLLPLAVTEDGQYDRLVTSMFLHTGVFHLASNMLALFLVGAPLERLLRGPRFLALYLVAGLGGSLAVLAWSPPNTLSIGASGAIFGLFGALVVLGRRVGADFRGMATLIVLNLVISFAIPGISWQAHVGGLITGFLVGAALLPTLPRRRRPAR